MEEGPAGAPTATIVFEIAVVGLLVVPIGGRADWIGKTAMAVDLVNGSAAVDGEPPAAAEGAS